MRTRSHSMSVLFRAAPRRLGVLLLPVLLVPACGQLEYLSHLAEGQLRAQRGTEPISKVLDSGRLTADDSEKLRLVVAARDYAANVMGLRCGESYTTFYDTSGDPLAWNLSAARRDALVPKTWEFPIVGVVPYLAFFDEAKLNAAEAKLSAEGYDTMTYELDAYSTLGFFEDPVRSPMLKRDPLSLAETIIHELLHNTIWRPNATVFNESLATFVGRQGAVEFLRAYLGDGSGWPEVAALYYVDVDTINAFLLDLYDELAAYYQQPISAAEKVAGREAVYAAARARFVSDVQPTLYYPEVFAGYARLPTNNAWVLANYRYNLDLGVFAAVYAATDSDWPASLAVFTAAAAAEDPFGYLREWLATR